MLATLQGLEGKPVPDFPPHLLDWLTRLLSKSPHFESLRPQEVAVYLRLAQFRLLAPQHRHLLDFSAVLLLDGWADLSLATPDPLRSSDHRPPYPVQVEEGPPLQYHHHTTALSFDFLCFWPAQKTAWLDSRIMVHTFHFTPVLVWTDLTQETVQSLKLKSETMSQQSVFLSIFPSFPEQDFHRITSSLNQRIKFARDQTIFKLGDPSEEVFILLGGEISIKKKGSSRLVGQNQMFGEEDMALSRLRTESARAASSRVTVLRISRTGLETISLSCPGFYRRLISEGKRKAKMRESIERAEEEQTPADNPVIQELKDWKRGIFIMRKRATSAPIQRKPVSSTVVSDMPAAICSRREPQREIYDLQMLEFVTKIEAQYSLGSRFISDNKREYSQKKVTVDCKPFTPGTRVNMRAKSADLYLKTKLSSCITHNRSMQQSPDSSSRSALPRTHHPKPPTNMFFFKHRQTKILRSSLANNPQVQTGHHDRHIRFAVCPLNPRHSSNSAGIRLLSKTTATLPK